MVDATSAVNIVQCELEKPSVKEWVGGDVSVHLLRKYRDWNAHFNTYSPIVLAALSCGAISIWFWVPPG